MHSGHHRWASCDHQSKYHKFQQSNEEISEPIAPEFPVAALINDKDHEFDDREIEQKILVVIPKEDERKAKNAGQEEVRQNQFQSDERLFVHD
jgi:hypothetical protein